MQNTMVQTTEGKGKNEKFKEGKWVLKELVINSNKSKKIEEEKRLFLQKWGDKTSYK